MAVEAWGRHLPQVNPALESPLRLPTRASPFTIFLIQPCGNGDYRNFRLLSQFGTDWRSDSHFCLGDLRNLLALTSSGIGKADGVAHSPASVRLQIKCD